MLPRTHRGQWNTPGQPVVTSVCWALFALLLCPLCVACFPPRCCCCPFISNPTLLVSVHCPSQVLISRLTCEHKMRLLSPLMNRRLLLLALLAIFLLIKAPIVLASSAAGSSAKGCPVAELQQCAEPLRAMGVPLTRNLVRLLLQIPSPNQLRRSCQAYASVMPCFHAKVEDCGSAAQREILRQLANAIQFLCSPFSALKQSQLLVHRLCIGRVLGQQNSLDSQCGEAGDSETTTVLHQCRGQCEAKPDPSVRTLCLIRTLLSEQNLCLLLKMRAECGRDAAAFYTQMQREIFHPRFPLICEEAHVGGGGGGQQYGQSTMKAAGSKFGTSTQPPSIFVTAKKKRAKAVAARLSDVRLKLGRSRSTTTTAAPKMATSSSSTIGRRLTTSGNLSNNWSSPRLANSTTKAISSGPTLTTSRPKGTLKNTAVSLPTAITGKSIGGTRNGNDAFRPRLTSPAPVHPPKTSPAPKTSTTTMTTASSNTRPSTARLKNATKQTATLLVQTVPFMLFPSAALGQQKRPQPMPSSSNHQRPAEAASMINNLQQQRQSHHRHFFNAPNWDGLQQSRWEGPPFGGARLVFFEVSPIADIIGQQFRHGWEDGRKK